MKLGGLHNAMYTCVVECTQVSGQIFLRVGVVTLCCTVSTTRHWLRYISAVLGEKEGGREGG